MSAIFIWFIDSFSFILIITREIDRRFYCCPLDFCNYQPKWSCRFCFHFVGLTTVFFAFYKTIWVGISLASIAVEAVATFQILGKKINPVTKMSRFTRPFGLGVLAVSRTMYPPPRTVCPVGTTSAVRYGTVQNRYIHHYDTSTRVISASTTFIDNRKHQQIAETNW